ncbi:hypothetical protein ACFYLX_03670 [Pseudarthrobacter enclensis]|uniref:hypothetical protein n=1 Tax=Pseudarthrobacter enclensis TaxID=993070 RepID=UPI0036B66923
MTPETRSRGFRASRSHYEKNLAASEATRVVPAQLLHPDDYGHDKGIAMFQGIRFVGVLTEQDARRVADDIHDLLDTFEQEKAA